MKPEDLPIASLSAVKARDKEAWLGLFEDDAVVEDPVGGFDPWDKTGEGQRGKEKISAFYDMFSAQQQSFDYEIHFLRSGGNEAACLVTMKMTMKDGSLNPTQAINVYKMSPNGKIASLRSFWG